MTSENRRKSFTKLFLSIGILFSSLAVVNAAYNAAYNVYFSSKTVEQDFVANTTSQYLVTLTPNPFFPNTYTMNVTGKRPDSTNPQLITMDNLLKRLEAQTTDYFIYGYLSGMTYERNDDLRITGEVGVNCSTDTVCSTPVMQIYQGIYQKFNSTNTVIVPGF